MAETNDQNHPKIIAIEVDLDMYPIVTLDGVEHWAGGIDVNKDNWGSRTFSPPYSYPRSLHFYRDIFSIGSDEVVLDNLTYRKLKDVVHTDKRVIRQFIYERT